MFLVALTGGIASGKSTVTRIFRENGVPIIDADAIARKVVEPGRPAWHKIKATFGETVFDADSGELNREALGRLIFDDVEKRRLLNEITHPEIHRIIYKEVIKSFFLGYNFVVLDLPLLFETRVMLHYIHKIITVTCEEDIQVTRLMDRSHYTEAEAKKRIKSQMPLELKCEQSHFVIENSGTLRDTEEQTLKILSILQDSNQHWKIRGIIFATAALLVSSIAWILNYKYRWFNGRTELINTGAAPRSAASSVKAIVHTLGDEIARLAGLADDLTDWHEIEMPDEADESVAAGLADDSHPSLWTHLKSVADHIDPHRFFSDSVAGAYEPAQDSATIGVAGLGHAQDRESLESDAETITDELSQNPDEVGSVHRPGSPYRPPPSAGHPDVEPHVPGVPQRPPYDRTPLFQHHFNTFFNTPLETGFFGAGLPGFNFFDIHANQPWWKGENVCTEREEKEEDVNASGGEVAVNGDGDDDGYSFRGFSMFNMNVETCTMKQNKYVCTSM
ncbi:hypothetical protein ZHAS_00020233 [Anopheles sinensis]|uniref:Dephospho-CoA kinase domain-containing protein n=1 Tax=Anopheles sinensis TaxID=74873 RepID=A0A084WPA5_ANOSI|nr:hypothetical protein ZHAS_00020233 [Anopheles sinensis]